jgi:quercetin dioxygenase-like cupin family protein
MKTKVWLCALLLLVSAAVAQDMKLVTPADQKFGPLPNFPDCVKGALLNGDPGSDQGALLMAKATAGCRIPWHWHTVTEQLGIVSGTTTMQEKGGQPKTLASGAYAFIPGKHQHEFVCKTACSLFVRSDGKFDIHYVDAGGKEISLADATKGGAAKGGEKKAAPKK